MKILILGGFLGSGKTTALMQLARYIVRSGGARAATDNPVDESRSAQSDEYRSKPAARMKVVILENEIGEAGIDDKFLRGDGFRVEDLFAGCACCTVSTELVAAADRIAKEMDPDWLIIETTGLAYPRLIRDNLQAARGLESRICILADASRWKRLLLPLNQLLSGQIIGSDVVLINKSDLADEAVLLKTEADIRAFDERPAVLRISAANPVPDEVWAKVLGE